MKVGWAIEPLSAVCSFERGLTYSKTDEVEFSSNGVLRANNIDLGSLILDLSEIRYISDSIVIPQRKKVRAGSLIICTASGSRSHLGKIAFVDKDYDYAFGGFMGQLTPNPRIEPRFLYYALRGRSFGECLGALAAGTNINNLKFSDISEFPVLLPPLDMQRQIVTGLDQAFLGIATATANAEKNLANARAVSTMAIQSIFAERSAGWNEYVLTDISENLDSRRRPVTKKDRVPGDVPYYGASGQVDSVRDSLFDDDLLLISEDGANLLMRNYPIAFSISGKSWVNNHAHILKFDDIATQRLVEYYLNSISLQPWVSGMAQPKLNQKALNQIPIPLPLTEDRLEIVERLDSLAEQTELLEEINEQRLTALTELQQSLLQSAFNGSLRPNPTEAIAA